MTKEKDPKIPRDKQLTTTTPSHDTNMGLWDSVCITPKEFVKEVKYSKHGKHKSISAQYQAKVATEKFGPYGKEDTWGLRHLEYNILGFEDWKEQKGKPMVPYISLDALFYYPGGVFEVSDDMVFDPEQMCRKKLITACISKALSRLGFSADIYFGMHDNQNTEAKADILDTPVQVIKAQENPGDYKIEMGMFVDQCIKDVERGSLTTFIQSKATAFHNGRMPPKIEAIRVNARAYYKWLDAQPKAEAEPEPLA